MGRDNNTTTASAATMALTPLIQADEGCFRDRIVTSFSLDVPARRIAVHSQVLCGEGEKPEVIAVRPVAMRGTRAAIARLPKIVDRACFIFLSCAAPTASSTAVGGIS